MLVDDGYAGKTVDLPIGQVIELRLAENPTTGFKWSFVSKGEPACKIIGDSYHAPGGPPGLGLEVKHEGGVAIAGDRLDQLPGIRGVALRDVVVQRGLLRGVHSRGRGESGLPQQEANGAKGKNRLMGGLVEPGSEPTSAGPSAAPEDELPDNPFAE